jgi:hypothetical protein
MHHLQVDSKFLQIKYSYKARSQIPFICYKLTAAVFPSLTRADEGHDRKANVITVSDTFLRLPYALDRLCGLVVRVPGYRSGGPGSISGTTRKKK